MMRLMYCNYDGDDDKDEEQDKDEDEGKDEEEGRLWRRS
jgi:hypothetical protein